MSGTGLAAAAGRVGHLTGPGWPWSACGWLAAARSGRRAGKGPCERAGQRVQQQVAGPEVGGAGPDVPAGDEFQRGPRGPRRTSGRPAASSSAAAQRPAGQVDLDLAGPAVPVVLDRPADQALAGAPSCPVSCPLSRAATHVPNGASTIRRSDSQAWGGRVPALMPGRSHG
jgi:hypothetical protein